MHTAMHAHMCILQIGELVSRLDDEFRAKYDGVPWRSIQGMRNILSYDYKNVNYDEAWATIETRIPELKKYCESVLHQISLIDESNGHNDNAKGHNNDES
jgi:uncharacterized protein with HEPN domain